MYAEDFSAAVDFLGTQPFVDGEWIGRGCYNGPSRIAVRTSSSVMP